MPHITSAVRGRIPVLRAAATGATTLSAFHGALVAVNLGQYNLVRLSSVVPPRTRVDPSGTADVPAGEWGDRLYCVYADHYATIPGEWAWAGVGWLERRDGRGGFLVEHSGSSEAAVVAAIEASLRDFRAGSPEDFGGAEWLLSGIECTGDPVCALVITPYAVVPWSETL
jgi:arginine decarboxylase